MQMTTLALNQRNSLRHRCINHRIIPFCIPLGKISSIKSWHQITLLAWSTRKHF